MSDQPQVHVLAESNLLLLVFPVVQKIARRISADKMQIRNKSAANFANEHESKFKKLIRVFRIIRGSCFLISVHQRKSAADHLWLIADD